MTVGKLCLVPREQERGLTPQEADALAQVLRSELERRWPDESWTYRAARIGMSQSQLSQVTQGSRARRPGAGIRVLVRIRNMLGIPIDVLLGLPPLTASMPPPIATEPEPSVDRIRAAIRAELDALAAAREATQPRRKKAR